MGESAPRDPAAPGGEVERRVFDALVAMQDLVRLYDAEGRVVYENRTDAARTHSDLIAPHARECRQVVRNGSPRRVDDSHVEAGGRRRFYETILTPLGSGDAAVHGVVGVTRDITERKGREMDAWFLDRLHSDLGGVTESGEILELARTRISGRFGGAVEFFDVGENERTARPAFPDPGGGGASEGPLDEFDLEARFAPASLEELRRGRARLERVRSAGATRVVAPCLIGTRWRFLLVVTRADPGTFSEQEVSLVEQLATRVWLWLDRARAQGDLRERRRSLHDINRFLEARIEERTTALEEQAVRLRTLAAELASAEQRERKRLAAVLHDDLQQLLFAAMMHVHEAQGLVREPRARSALESVAHRLDEAVAAARDLTHQLRPPALYEAGLVPALEWLATDMLRRHGLWVVVDAQEAEIPLEDDVKALVFECVRELLFNVVKHAAVGEAAVQLLLGDDVRLTVVVEDGGAGFDPEALAPDPGGGFGLVSVKERLLALGGSVTIDSKAGEGTRVRLDVPVSPVPRATAGTAPADSGEKAAARTDPGRGREKEDERIRILVVDDHAMVREGLANILRSDQHLIVVGEASDGIEALHAVERLRPDVVLLDVNMPRMNGVEATREIRRRWPSTTVFGLSVQNDDVTAQSMLDVGAAAFIPKAGGSGHMIGTILRHRRMPRD